MFGGITIITNLNTPNNLFKNLYFDSEEKEKIYTNWTKNSLATGNATSKHLNNVACVVIDLAPGFSFSQNSLELRENILSCVFEKANILPYITYIYKTPIVNKVAVNEYENVYDILHNATIELEYVIQNFLLQYNVLIIYLGRYAEYNQIQSLIGYANQQMQKNINNIYLYHPSYYLKDYNNFKNTKAFKNDVRKIIEKINTIKKSSFDIFS